MLKYFLFKDEIKIMKDYEFLKDFLTNDEQFLQNLIVYGPELISEGISESSMDLLKDFVTVRLKKRLKHFSIFAAIRKLRFSGNSFENIKNKILSYDDFKTILSSFKISHLHGTFESKELSLFIYVKGLHQVDSKEEINHLFQILEFVTFKKIFHPETVWSAYIHPKGYYQIFAIMKKLLRQPLKDRINERFILSWLKRIDPHAQKLLPTNKIGWMLNLTEASQPDNWGFDNKTGLFYPVDVEVMSLSSLKE